MWHCLSQTPVKLSCPAYHHPLAPIWLGYSLIPTSEFSCISHKLKSSSYLATDGLPTTPRWQIHFRFNTTGLSKKHLNHHQFVAVVPSVNESRPATKAMDETPVLPQQIPMAAFPRPQAHVRHFEAAAMSRRWQNSKTARRSCPCPQLHNPAANDMRTQNDGKYCCLAEPAVKRIYHPAMAAVLDVVYNSNVETLARDLGGPCATDRQVRLEKSSAPVRATKMSHPHLAAARQVQIPFNLQKQGQRMESISISFVVPSQRSKVLNAEDIFLYASAWCHRALIPKRDMREPPQFIDKTMQFRYR
ncbi:uncharacterized protein CLUP02_04853 [Colletotrichum lupini]|uniref:Uncharacterized protein n=1 Tax=Colletotrichum lupini TaxID=145971 RepID=A0A9Q8WDI2_9PEZI|nr:uncharacterized protein CLUP02_04853 [Colletotrichum lupini]UQC79374.1 hypothetical protein CLUP02_04853 [Colletotrichum lupini]